MFFIVYWRRWRHLYA